MTEVVAVSEKGQNLVLDSIVILCEGKSSFLLIVSFGWGFFFRLTKDVRNSDHVHAVD